MEDKRELILNAIANEVTIRQNIELIASTYKELFKKDLCRSCPAEMQLAIMKLKQYYKVLEFHFKRPIAQYKIKQSDRFTISNSNLTNELAIAFLQERKGRIELFDVYPENWQELIEFEGKTEGEKEAYMAAKAEMKALEDSKKNEEAQEGSEVEEEVQESEGVETEEEQEEAQKLDVKSLKLLKLSELRRRYPLIKARKKSEFIKELLESVN